MHAYRRHAGYSQTPYLICFVGIDLTDEWKLDFLHTRRGLLGDLRKNLHSQSQLSAFISLI